MKTDREEDKCFNFRLVFVFISHSVKRISMDSIQKSGEK